MTEKLVYKCIVGSQAYGTAIEGKSDVDYKGIYIQSNNDILSFNYKPQIEVGKDETYYEIRRWLELAQTANPTILEMLFMHDACILHTSPIFELLRSHRHKFLTKQCRNSFGGYAVAQIKKAKGLDKKMNWEKTRVERKTPLDFIHAHIRDGKTMPLANWLERTNKVQEKCGLVAMNHFRDCYALFYDHDHFVREEPLKYKGIIRPNSNEVCLSSVPEGENTRCIIHYNKDGYSQHCKDYNEYQTWLENRNTARYVDNIGHGQQIDSKNLLHCRRLLDTAIEIATTNTINVQRPNAQYLLSIRHGKVPLNQIIEQAEADLKMLDELYENCNLPDAVDKNFVNELLIQIRHL